MIDFFDIIAFVVLAVLLAAIVVVVVTLGSLPGQMSQKRGHPHEAAVTLAGWVGIALIGLGAIARGPEGGSFTLMGIVWPLALIWAFWKPATAGLPSAPQANADKHQDGREVAS